jgi:hypothetical protein
MSENALSFMESRFGTDFSGVKIHTDTNAVQMSRELNAQAFTVGSDIYFNSGKYAPESASGKHLLAHELTHTVQQGGGIERKVQRRGGNEFEIHGLDDNRANINNFIFFDINKPDNVTAPENDIDSVERVKINEFAQNHSSGIQLNGFASEEGTESNNTQLVNLRLQSVRNVLSSTNYTQPIQSQSLLRLSQNQYDYRNWRAVEMTDLGQTSSRIPTGAAAANGGNEPCSTENINDVVIPAQSKAIEQIDICIDALNDFISNAANNTATGDALNFAFHSNSLITARMVRERLSGNRVFLSRMIPITQCGTLQSLMCGETIEALTSSQSITLCQSFFNPERTLEGRASTFVHESSHGSTFNLNDRAYRHERVLNVLNTRQALDNAESYSIFLEIIVNGAIPDNIGPQEADTVNNCGTDEQLVRTTIAWAERWNTYAALGLQQIYGNDQLGDWKDWFDMQMRYYFGNADRMTYAGVLDKHLQMMAFLESGTIEIDCVDRTDPLYSSWKIASWQDRTLRISNQQLRAGYLNTEDKVKYIFGALAVDNFGVPENHRMSYPNIARLIKILYWGVEG